MKIQMRRRHTLIMLFEGFLISVERLDTTLPDLTLLWLQTT